MAAEKIEGGVNGGGGRGDRGGVNLAATAIAETN
jgi:hypothetical protein